MANQDQLSLIDDDGRRRAIRAAMTAAGHLEEIIVDTLAELGLKKGGIVGLKHGGIMLVLVQIQKILFIKILISKVVIEFSTRRNTFRSK